VAAVGYTLQLYIDFTGYSDMAIGLARMFGLKLPLNFHSPLRAPSIIEYWRRWHMTLQRFIVSYIFQPLSLPLNRVAAHLGLDGWSAFTIGSALPVFITFVAVGFWHGAGWTFGLFGVMHGVYLSLNQAWREVQAQRRRKFKRAGLALGPAKVWQTVLSHVITVIAVIYSQVMFRSDNPSVAVWIWRSMTGLGGANLAPAEGFNGGLAASLIVAAGLVFLAPNSQQIMGRFDPALNWREWRDAARAPFTWTWKPNLAGLLFAGTVLFVGVMFIQRGRAVFLYFNF
jgi:D-alanyl-lipoteichoic acid acyltransferase DltB (MBOAT superfamily)